MMGRGGEGGDPPYVTSPIWGLPPPCKKALRVLELFLGLSPILRDSCKRHAEFRLSQLLGWRITVTKKYPENVARSPDELALCSKELCSFSEFEMVVSSTDWQQARRHSEIVKLLVPQGKNEVFRSRLGYRNLRLHECRGLIQIIRTSTGGEHYFCYLFCCVFR